MRRWRTLLYRVLGLGIILFLIQSLNATEARAESLSCRGLFQVSQKSKNSHLQILDDSARDQIVKNFEKILLFSEVDKISYISKALQGEVLDHHFYLDIENAFLKKLNDLTHDKPLITALTNMYLHLVKHRVLDLKEQKYKNLQIRQYADFKSIRFAFDASELNLQQRENLKKDLSQLFDSINEQYQQKLNEVGLNFPQALARDWFRAGFGKTADQANLAARTSRDMGGRNSVRDFADNNLQNSLRVFREWALSFYHDFNQDSAVQEFLLDRQGLLHRRAIDIIRKTPDTEKLKKRIYKVYGVKLANRTIWRLQRYVELVDGFNPSIFVVDHKRATLETAHFGGFSADFSGLGAANLWATSQALHHSKDVVELVQKAREGEKQITLEFKKYLSSLYAVVLRYYRHANDSGDDFVGYGDHVVSERDRMQMLREILLFLPPTLLRVAFIEGTTESKFRNKVAAHGEAIEKEIRKIIEGELSVAELDSFQLAVIMKGSVAGEGDVELIVTPRRDFVVSPEVRKTFVSAFIEAVQTINRSSDEGRMKYRSRQIKINSH